MQSADDIIHSVQLVTEEQSWSTYIQSKLITKSFMFTEEIILQCVLIILHCVE